jgi:nuclear pore complex protein Nup88
VERLSVNGETSRLAIIGLRGVAVLDLPKRWGKDATFHGGKPAVTCR